MPEFMANNKLHQLVHTINCKFVVAASPAFKFLFVLLYIIISGNSVFGQNECKIRLTGFLTAGKDSVPVISAEIYSPYEKLRTSTSATGEFALTGLCAGMQILEIDIAEEGHFHVDLNINGDTTIHIHLLHEIRTLKETHIRVHHSHRLNEISFTGIQISFTGDLSAVLSGINGIQMLKSGNNVSKPVSDGFSGLRLPVVINGTRLAGQQWGNDHSPEASALNYDQIRLVQGTEALIYATEGFGGVLLLENTGSQLHTGELDLISSTGFEHNGNKFSQQILLRQKPHNKPYDYFIQLSGRISGNISTPDYLLNNTGMREITGSTGFNLKRRKNTHHANLSYFSAENGIYSGTRVGNVADLLNRIQLNEPDIQLPFTYQITPTRQTLSHLTAQYSAEKKSDSQSRVIQLSLQYDSRKEFDFHRSSLLKFPQLDLGLLSLTAAYRLEKQYRNYFFRYGIQGMFEAGGYGGYYFIPDFNHINPAVYAGLEKSGIYKNSLILRSEMHLLNARGGPVVSPGSEDYRFQVHSAAYEISRKIRKSELTYSVALLGRAPWVNELFSMGVHHGSVAFETGNKNLVPEKNLSQFIRYNNINRKHQTELRVYSNLIKDYIQISPDAIAVQTIRGAFPSYTYRQFNAVIAGVDVNSEFHVFRYIRFHFRGNYIYSRNISENTFVPFTPPMALQGGFIYENEKVSIQLNARKVFRQWDYSPGSDLLPPPRGFEIISLSANLTRPGFAKNWNFIIGCDNLLNKTYREYTDRFRYFADAQGRNIYIKALYNLHKHQI